MKINYEENLVIQSFIIGKLLLDLKSQNFLQSSYFKENFNDYFSKLLEETTLDSQGNVIALFYLFLVVPKELFKNKLKSEYVNINSWIKKLIDEKQFLLKTNYIDSDYLKHMRNSIAHVRIKFVGGDSITFIDMDKYKGKNCKFELKIPLSHINIILNKLAKCIFDYFLKKQQE